MLNGKKKIENLTKEEEEYLGGNDSFFWNRFYKNNENRCEVLNRTLDLVKIKNGGMVLGHTPHNNITNYCRKQLYFADIGLSRAFGNEFNKKQILHIKLGHKPVIII